MRPIVEYACPVWHGNEYQAYTTIIERIPKRACRIIFGSTYTSYAETLSSAGLQTGTNWKRNADISTINLLKSALFHRYNLGGSIWIDVSKAWACVKPILKGPKVQNVKVWEKCYPHLTKFLTYFRCFFCISTCGWQQNQTNKKQTKNNSNKKPQYQEQTNKQKAKQANKQANVFSVRYDLIIVLFKRWWIWHHRQFNNSFGSLKI